MATFTYPNSDLDRRETLLSLLGSHWHNTYQGSDLVESLRYATAQEAAQTHLDLLETVDTLSRTEVPVFHREDWYLLSFLASEVNNRPLQYDGETTYGAGAKYGEQPGRQVYEVPIPANLKQIPAIFNRITQPSRSMVEGVDYSVDTDNAKLILGTDPFADALIPKRDVYADGEVTDQEASLWCYKGAFDEEYIHEHHGFIIGLKTVSSESYRDMVAAVMDAFVVGGIANQVNFALSALSGVPVVKNPEEVIELVIWDNNHLVIGTDLEIYLFPLTDTPVVAVGDTVTTGQFLTEAITVNEFNDGAIPANLGALVVEAGLLASGYAGGVTFENKTVNTTVTENVDGKTKIEWPLGGFPADITAFWDDVHVRGVASGVALSNLLDVRTSPVGEPKAPSLPATVNPLEFLISNVLRFHAFLVRVKVNESTRGVGLKYSPLLRRIIHPWTSMILLYELDVDDGEVTLSGSETLSSFSAGELQTDTLDLPTNVTESVQLRQIDGVCQ